jgi:hypothetical protein
MHSNNIISGTKGVKGFVTVTAPVVKPHTWPMGTRFPAGWKSWTQHQFHNVTVLLSHRIDNLKCINPLNHGQHKLLVSDLLPEVLAGHHCTIRAISWNGKIPK